MILELREVVLTEFSATVEEIELPVDIAEGVEVGVGDTPKDASGEAFSILRLLFPLLARDVVLFSIWPLLVICEDGVEVGEETTRVSARGVGVGVGLLSFDCVVWGSWGGGAIEESEESSGVGVGVVVSIVLLPVEEVV